MNIQSEFQLAAGSVRGTDHVLSDKPNQDAFKSVVSKDHITAVVCDGCGSGKHSEVGAKIGVRMIVETIEKLLRIQPTVLFDDSPPNLFWERVRQDVLAQLRVLVNSMGGSLSQTVTDYFLFTIVGSLMTPNSVSIFSIGDGVFTVNGRVTPIGPFPDNEPPYLSYNLTGSKVSDKHPGLLNFKVHETLLTRDIQSVLIGCDGVGDLIEAEKKKIPGKNELAGPISQFWENDQFFKNPDMVRRRLVIMNKPSQKIDWKEKKVCREKGLLHDDTTLIVVRRTPEVVE